MEAVDSTRYRQPMQLNITFVDEDGDFVSSAAVLSTVGESTYNLTARNIPEGYELDYANSGSYFVSSIQNNYTISLNSLSEPEWEEAQFWELFWFGQTSYEDYYKQDFLLKEQGENPRK